MKILKRLLFALLMIPIVFVYIITVIVAILLYPLFCIIGIINWIITGKYSVPLDCIYQKHYEIFFNIEDYIRDKLLNHEE